jgi:GH25 family lysozyme M1 (1,4-beta-N-acetylmuramidase)
MKIRIILGLCIVFGLKAQSQTILGIDVSSYQNTVNWTQVKAAGYTFAWAKATEGLTVTDAQYSNNAVNGPAAGMYMGAYHFAHPDTHTATADAVSEANHFLSVAQPYIISCELPPALDYEVSTSLTQSQQVAWIQAWMNTVHTATGIMPILYTDGSIANSLGSALVGYCKLWIADPDGSPTALPSTTYQGSWYPNYSFKQYSFNGTVTGVGGSAVDLDSYNGTLAQLKNDMVCTPPVCHTYYAALPYNTSFENTWITDSCNGYIAQRLPDKYWKSSIGGTTPNGNDYWHREDYTGSDWTSTTNGAYTPAGSAGNHSARFHNDPPPAGSTGALDLYINLSASGTKTISFDYIHNEVSPSPFSFDVMLSSNGGTSFPTTLLTITTAQMSSWTTQTFTTNATSATSVLRFIATDKGTSDVGVDNLNVALNTTTSISNVNADNYHVSIYPNPTTDNFVVKAEGIMNEMAIDIYSASGQYVLHKQANPGETEIQISNLSKGMYFVTVYCDKIKTTTQKLLVIE